MICGIVSVSCTYWNDFDDLYLSVTAEVGPDQEVEAGLVLGADPGAEVAAGQTEVAGAEVGQGHDLKRDPGQGHTLKRGQGRDQNLGQNPQKWKMMKRRRIENFWYFFTI